MFGIFPNLVKAYDMRNSKVSLLTASSYLASFSKRKHSYVLLYLFLSGGSLLAGYLLSYAKVKSFGLFEIVFAIAMMGVPLYWIFVCIYTLFAGFNATKEITKYDEDLAEGKIDPFADLHETNRAFSEIQRHSGEIDEALKVYERIEKMPNYFTDVAVAIFELPDEELESFLAEVKKENIVTLNGEYELNKQEMIDRQVISAFKYHFEAPCNIYPNENNVRIEIHVGNGNYAYYHDYSDFEDNALSNARTFKIQRVECDFGKGKVISEAGKLERVNCVVFRVIAQYVNETKFNASRDFMNKYKDVIQLSKELQKKLNM